MGGAKGRRLSIGRARHPLTLGSTAPPTFGSTPPPTFGSTAPPTFGSTPPPTFGSTPPPSPPGKPRAGAARRPAAIWAAVAAWAPALVWAYLALARGRFWSTRSRVPADNLGMAPARWPAATVVVPARNESELIPQTLPRLLAQDYRGPLHVVVVDDRSADGTAQVARQVEAQAVGRESDRRLSVLEGKPLPPGWAGKPWAMAQGLEWALSQEPRPAWALFTDADIAHPSSSVAALVAAAEAGGRQYVSVMARLSAADWWERLLMPAFVYFFAQIYPFSWVNDRRRPHAAAAGGCFLVGTTALDQVGGIEAIKASVIDDVALARALHRAGQDGWLALAGGGGPGEAPAVESLRRYRRLGQIWDMVARSAYTQLGHSPVAVAGALAGLSAVYLAPPLLALGGLARRRPLVALPGLAAWTIMSATYLPMTAYYQTSPWSAPALPFTASVYMAMTLSSALRHHRGGPAWREPGT